MEPRFDYAKYKSRERAELGLEDMFASGEVSEGERPKIVRRNTENGVRYFITLPM